MANTTVLDLEQQDVFSTPQHPTRDAEEDRLTNANWTKVDNYAATVNGKLSSSFCETFYVSGAMETHLGQGADVGGEFYGGLRYNPGPTRTITEIVAYARMSGSGGFTRIDVQLTESGQMPTSNESIFPNEASKPHSTASDGDGYIMTGSVFAAGSASWAAGKLLGVVVEEAPTALGADLTVQIYWKQ